MRNCFAPAFLTPTVQFPVTSGFRLPNDLKITKVEGRPGKPSIEHDQSFSSGGARSPQLFRLHWPGNTRTIPGEILIWDGTTLFVSSDMPLNLEVENRRTRRAISQMRLPTESSDPRTQSDPRLQKAKQRWSRWHSWGDISDGTQIVGNLSRAASQIYILFSGGERKFLPVAFERAALRAEFAALEFLRCQREVRDLLDFRVFASRPPKQTGRNTNLSQRKRVLLEVNRSIHFSRRDHVSGLRLPAEVAWLAVQLAFAYGWNPEKVAQTIYSYEQRCGATMVS